MLYIIDNENKYFIIINDKGVYLKGMSNNISHQLSFHKYLNGRSKYTNFVICLDCLLECI